DGGPVVEFSPSRDKFVGSLRKSSTLYIVDVGANPSRPPLQCNAVTIVIVSPHAKRSHGVRGWKKQTECHTIYVMPIWSEEELQICCRVTRPSIQEIDDDGINP